jgi:sugar phosphate isomerase/epimerase
MQESDLAWKKEIEEALEAADECGFTFVQAHAPGYNPGRDSSDYDRCIRAMQRSVEACAMLGIPVTVMHTSFSPEFTYPDDKEGYYKYNRKFVGDVLSAAEKFGVTLCIENTSNGNAGKCYFPRSGAEMNDFIAHMDHPLLGACWDTGHAVMDRIFDQYAELKELGPVLKAVHIHDNGVHSDQHLAPYCGKLQLDSVVKGLLDIDYKGSFTFEADSFLNHCNGEGPLRQLPLEIRRDGLALLYKIGKFALETYNAYEE